VDVVYGLVLRQEEARMGGGNLLLARLFMAAKSRVTATKGHGWCLVTVRHVKVARMS